MSTLTLGGSTLASKSGSVLSLDSGVNFPAGSIIGFNYAITTTEVSGITIDSWVTTGLSVSITPKKSNSKIYVLSTFGIAINNPGHFGFKVVRTAPTSQDLTIQASYTSVGWASGTSSYSAIDTPSSLSECTYTLYHYVDANSGNFNWNYDANFTPGANLMVMEIQQ